MVYRQPLGARTIIKLLKVDAELIQRRGPRQYSIISFSSHRHIQTLNLQQKPNPGQTMRSSNYSVLVKGLLPCQGQYMDWSLCLSSVFLSFIESPGLFAVFELSKYVRRSK